MEGRMGMGLELGCGMDAREGGQARSPLWVNLPRKVLLRESVYTFLGGFKVPG